MESEWNFDETIRGTVTGVPVNLNLADMDNGFEDEDEEEDDWNVKVAEVKTWDGSVKENAGDLLVKGKLAGSEMFLPVFERQSNRRNTPRPFGISASNMDPGEKRERIRGDDEPKTPTSTSLSPSQRSSQSSRESASSGKSTWKERNDKVRGTVVKEGDVGDGYVFHSLLLIPFPTVLSLLLYTIIHSLIYDTQFEHGN